MTPKKVLFVINNFNIGGPQKSLLSLLYRLNYDQIEASLLILSGKGSLTKYLPKQVNLLKTPDIVEYATLTPDRFIKKTVSTLFSRNFLFSLKAISKVISGRTRNKMTHIKQEYWIEIKDALPKLNNSFDVAIGVSGGHSMMYIADCVKASMKIGWIRTDYRVLGRDQEIDAVYFNEMDKIISVSSICKEIFIDVFPTEESKVQVMYNVLPFEMYKNIPADTKALTREEKCCKLLSISRLDPHKGLDLAIETLEILLKKGFKIKWYVLGDGNYRKEIEKLVKIKGLQKNFVLLGFHVNTAAFIQECDILVHPSKFEGKSNVIDEAKYLLKPIVATNFNTVNEQLSHEWTGLISDMDPESLSQCIQDVLTKKELKDRFQKNLLNERYDDSKSLETFYSIVNI
ncbi:glycosyltransferase [Bacillus norwichensis]|uniref:Glycosyltransferase n=1 Tax=Bacillus norwichensis TaxID=2762217 RepID=A0ABR8VHL6_9BACI|nr:glycosyltransferase [Bacillus norwichensis]MBD8004257.1 glycosyltransferase [Bacillus norwichensis]